MKKILSVNSFFAVLCLTAFGLFIPQTVFSQAEKLGVVSYTPPKGWTKIAKVGNGIRYTPTQSSLEAVIRVFYNGYIRSTGKGVDPFGKRSTLKKHLTARLIREQVTAHEASQDADYFLKAMEYHAEWENNFNISKPAVSGPTATAFVTFPNASRVKVTLRKAAGIWKIDNVQNGR